MSDWALPAEIRRLWTERLFDAARWPALRVGAAGGLVLVATFLVLELVTGRLALASAQTPPSLAEDIRIAVVMLLVLAYVPSAYVFAARRARETWRQLAPALRGPAAEREALLASAGAYARGGLLAAGLLGIAAGALVQILTDQNLDDSFNFAKLHREALLHRILNVSIAWWIGRFIYASRAEGRRLSRAGRDLLEIELLDTRAAAPLVRHALLSSLLAIGLLSLSALMLYDVQAAPALGAALAILLPASALLAGSLLLMPLRGVRDAIASAKRAELAWCNDQIRRRRRDASERAEPAPAAGGLADLVAYKEHVEAVHEWPIDTPTAARFLLYLGLPLGSWLGGAMVERIVDSLLE